MKTIYTIYENINENTAVTVGKFDGMHKGHELLVNNIKIQSNRGYKSCILSFDVSPNISLGKKYVGQLITNEERQAMLEREGIDYLLQCNFEKEIMNLEPKEFIELLVNNFNMKYMTCGTDFHFGKKGAGDVELLAKLSEEMGFGLEVIEKLQANNRDISSTYIKDEILKGNVALANKLLGYKYSMWGQVVHGNHLGRRYGLPTINILPPDIKLLPPNGVYITEVYIDSRKYHGVTNIGTKPTVSGDKIVGVETHILDFNKDVYEKQVQVVFLEYIRPERKFNSLDELFEQMNKDKNQARDYFNYYKNVTNC